MENQIQQLELRITELENKLKQQSATSPASSINPEDLKTYQKVSAQLLQITCYICRPHLCWPPLCICPCGPGFASLARLAGLAFNRPAAAAVRALAASCKKA